MSNPPILKRRASKSLRLDLMTLAASLRARAKYEEDPDFNELHVQADNMFAAYVIAQTIRDGFVFVAKAIRQSIDDPIDY